MNNRKILIITNRVPYPLKDGGNMAMHAMIEGYHRSGWKVHLLTMNTSKHYVKPDAVSRVFAHLSGVTTVEINNDVNWKGVLRNFFFGREPEHARRFYSEDFKQTLKQVLADFVPDVVQVESVYLSTYLPVIKKYSEAVTVLRMHNVEYQIWQGLARKEKNKLKTYYLDNLTIRVRDFERAMWKEYDLLLAITEKDAHLVQRLEEVERIIVAPFSIETEKIKPPDVPQEWVGYHIGAMDWAPNNEGMRWFLGKAWPLIRKSAPKFKFYFAGRGMSKEFKDMKLTNVECMGEVPDADAFIADKKILIVPLWSGGGIRVKILEAMASGKIVITTAKGIKGIEAKADEHFLRANSPEDFAKAVKWCMENKMAAEKISVNARALVVEKYEWKKVISDVIQAVEELVATRKHS
jgi:glycosyltransferase involved in cell wall biosynthesis